MYLLYYYTISLTIHNYYDNIVSMVVKFVISKESGVWKLIKTKRIKVETLIRKLESKVSNYLCLYPDKKTAIIVKYDKGYLNETLNSNNINYLMWTTICFLEDYLSKVSFNNLSKKYG